MFREDIFDKWLDEEAQRVLEKLRDNEPLTQDDKLIIVIKGLTNHIFHIDTELREDIKELRIDMDKRFEQVDKRFEQVDKRFEQFEKHFEKMTDEIKKIYQSVNSQTWKMIGAVGPIVLLDRFFEVSTNRIMFF